MDKINTPPKFNTSQFYPRFFKEIFLNIGNNYNNNYDYYSFGKEPFKNLAKDWIYHLLAKKKIVKASFNKVFSRISPYLNGFENLYELLDDESSKELLIKILAYRMLGYKKIKLPLNTPSFWDLHKSIERNFDKRDFLKHHHLKLKKISLDKFGYPINIFATLPMIYTIFIAQQYKYYGTSFTVGAEQGDTIIDAGGYWGDTALYFAHHVGNTGRVYTFEFVPSNLELMKMNFLLNPREEKSIQIVERAIWNEPNKPLSFLDRGAESKAEEEKIKSSTVSVKSITIDEFVEEYKINKIDFIKMDIEGAEMKALIGSIKTLKKFKPRLAIALYHSLDDFVNIPQFIKALNLDYKIYLGHSTIHSGETILFAN